MKKISYWSVIVLTCMGSLCIPLMVIASPVTYQYIGNYFDTFDNNLGGHGDYDATNRLELTIITLDGPFVVGDNAANVASFSFLDGRLQITQLVPHTLTLQVHSIDSFVPGSWSIEARAPIATLEHLIGTVSGAAPGTIDIAAIYEIPNGDGDMGLNRDTPGTWTTTAVPIPGAVWLLGSSIVGLVGLRRKFRK